MRAQRSAWLIRQFRFMFRQCAAQYGAKYAIFSQAQFILHGDDRLRFQAGTRLDHSVDVEVPIFTASDDFEEKFRGAQRIGGCTEAVVVRPGQAEGTLDIAFFRGSPEPTNSFFPVLPDTEAA